MKKIMLFTVLLLMMTMLLHAQEVPPQIPPPKNMIDVKGPKLPPQPVKLIGNQIDLPPLPNTAAAILTLHSWKLIRWWTDPNAGHSVTDANFRFMTGGTVSCNLLTPEAKTSLQSGTYSVRNNNITIVLKKDANVIMNCTLVYNSSAKNLTGTYTLQVLPVSNPPAGYTPGTVNGDMKIEMNP